MGKQSEVSIMTRKARMMQAREAAYVQSIGDAADYERGREVRVYDSFSTRAEVARREEFVGRRRMLTPVEDWCVSMGYLENPYQKSAVPKERRALYTVTYRDGRRRSFKTIWDARAELTRSGSDALKLWNTNNHSYEYAM